MADDSESNSGSSKKESSKAQLAAEKSKKSRFNADTKDLTDGVEEKAGEKPSEGGDAPSADTESIPSSVDPDATPNSADSNPTGDSNSSNSDE